MKLLGIAINGLFIFLSLYQTGLAETVKKVFIVASYEAEHVCGRPQETGVITGLIQQGWIEGINLEVKSYYMDTKRKHTSPEGMKERGREALSLIWSYNPDIVITIDDNAFREVGLFLINKPNISLVFSGMNNQPENYNRSVPFMLSREKPNANVTGVYEKLHVVQSIKVLSGALPDLSGNKMVGITDYSPTGRAIAEQFRIELKQKPANINWELKKVKDWSEYTELIKQLNADESVKAIYPVALSLKVSESETYTAPQIFKWTLENSKKPEMALNNFFSKIGLFGGAAVDFEKMGTMAGIKAGRILNGEQIGNIPIEDAADFAIVFNATRAKVLGINIPLPLLTAADHVYQ